VAVLTPFAPGFLRQLWKHKSTPPPSRDAAGGSAVAGRSPKKLGSPWKQREPPKMEAANAATLNASSSVVISGMPSASEMRRACVERPLGRPDTRVSPSTLHDIDLRERRCGLIRGRTTATQNKRLTPTARQRGSSVGTVGSSGARGAVVEARSM